MMGLRGRPSVWAAAARRWLASIVRHCRLHVVLVLLIGLLVPGASRPSDQPGASQASGQRGASRRQPAGAGATMLGAAAMVLEAGSWVTRISAGPSALVDAAGNRWSSDTGYVGGRWAATGARIEGTSSPAIYQHERSGMGGYAIPVPAPGTYAVDLYLAETEFSAPHQRVFDVSAEGVVKASGVDIAMAVGRNRAYHVIFTVGVTDGRLDLGFVDKVADAKVNGIEVAFVGPSTAPRQLAWSDEFDGPQDAPVDPRRWSHEVGGAWGDQELESYTDRPANSYQDGRGHLVIAARAERFTGADSITRDYTSARISTRDRYSFRYGTFEARMQTPVGKGVWPAFWALGTDIDRSGWPRCGEIDVMESLGHEPRKASGTIHGPRSGRGARPDYASGYSVVHASPLSQGFHTYGVQWLPGSIEFSFDGRPYGTVTAADLPAGSLWPFDHPFYLVLNVAVGGRLPGRPDGTRFPQALRVDYVRVFR